MANPQGKAFIQTLIARASAVSGGSAAWYRLNEATTTDGSVIVDSGPSPENAVVHGSGMTQTGIGAGLLVGDTTAGSVTFTAAGAIDVYTGGTPNLNAKWRVSTWSAMALINPTAVTGGWGIIAMNHGWTIGPNSNGTIHVTNGFILSSLDISTVATIPTNKASAVCVSYNQLTATTATVIVNTVQITAGAPVFTSETFNVTGQTPGTGAWTTDGSLYVSIGSLGILGGNPTINGKIADALILLNYAASSNEMNYYGYSALAASPATPNRNHLPAVQRVRRFDRDRPIAFELKATADGSAITNAIIDGIAISLYKNGAASAAALGTSSIAHLTSGQYILPPHPFNTDTLGSTMMTVDYLGSDTCVVMLDTIGVDPSAPDEFASGVSARTMAGNVAALVPSTPGKPNVHRVFCDSIISAVFPYILRNARLLAGFNAWANQGQSTWGPQGGAPGVAQFDYIGGRYHAAAATLSGAASIGQSSFIVAGWNPTPASFSPNPGASHGGAPSAGMKVTIDTGGNAETFYITEAFADQSTGFYDGQTVPLSGTFTKSHAAGTVVTWGSPTGDDSAFILPVPTFRFSGATLTNPGNPRGATYAYLRMPGSTAAGDSLKERAMYSNGMAFGALGVTAVIIYRAGPGGDVQDAFNVWGIPAESNFGTANIVNGGVINFYNATWIERYLVVTIPQPTTYDDTRTPALAFVGAGHTPTANTAGTILDVIWMETNVSVGDIFIQQGMTGLEMQDYEGSGQWGTEMSAAAHTAYLAALAGSGVVNATADVVTHNCLGVNAMVSTPAAFITQLTNVKTVSGATWFVPHSTPESSKPIGQVIPEAMRAYVVSDPKSAMVDVYSAIKDKAFRKLTTADDVHPTIEPWWEASVFTDAIEYARNHAFSGKAIYDRIGPSIVTGIDLGADINFITGVLASIGQKWGGITYLRNWLRHMMRSDFVDSGSLTEINTNEDQSVTGTFDSTLDSLQSLNAAAQGSGRVNSGGINVDWNYNGGDLRILRQGFGGINPGISGIRVEAYIASEYNANSATAVVRGFAVTNDLGQWFGMRLTSGVTYTLRANLNDGSPTEFATLTV